MPIQRLVLDVLLPHETDLVDIARKLTTLKGVSGVLVDVAEQDERTKTVEVTLEGGNLSFRGIRGVIEQLGGAVHSVDKVYATSNARQDSGE